VAGRFAAIRSMADGLRQMADVVRKRRPGFGGPYVGPESDRRRRFVDACHLKVHQDACGGKGGKQALLIGLTKGVSNTKLHAVVDGKGRLVSALTAGQVSDAKIGPGLVNGLEGCRVVADKGYDSRAMREAVERSGSRSCIPLRKGNTAKADFHKGWHRNRLEVENFFQRIRRLRRIATRYDKLAMVFPNFILLAATLDWIHSL
jgi:transposase